MIRLEPLGPQHRPEMEVLVADPDVQRYTLIPVPPPDGYAMTWIERYSDPEVRLGYAAYDGDGTFAGIGLIPAIDREGLEAELGYMTPPAVRGRGYAVRIVEALTRMAFEDLGMLRLILQIDPGNAASQKVARRAGYTLEGTLRSKPFKQGARCDLQIWSRLPSDPPL